MKRIAVYLGMLLAILGGARAVRHWSPERTFTTEHFIINSAARDDQTRMCALIGEMLFAEYTGVLRQLDVPAGPSGPLKVKLFRDADEFHAKSDAPGWAEAYYKRPYCHLYCAEGEASPYQWMVHEATHQMNAEVAKRSFPVWLEEGLATYFGTSQISGNRITAGKIDINTYPVWWIGILATAGDLEKDKANASVIPLRCILAGAGGPKIDKAVNLYYLHWWTLMHFLMHGQNGIHRSGLAKLMRDGASVRAFEQDIGTIDTVERQWYEYALELKSQLSGRTPAAASTNAADRAENASFYPRPGC